MAQAAAQLCGGLLRGSTQNPLFGSVVVFGSGAWTRLVAKDPSLATLGVPTTLVVPWGAELIRLETRTLAAKQDSSRMSQRAQAALAALLSQASGASVRALTRAEMAQWWAFIAFDITEPVLVVETQQPAYRFVLLYSGEGVGWVEELNALPRLGDKKPEHQ